MNAPLEARGADPSRTTLGGLAASRIAACGLIAALLFCVAPIARSAPYIWDEDGDRIDDRIETVNLLGFSFSFELGDSTLRQRIDVQRIGVGLVYSVFVHYDHAPTDSDLATLNLLGMPVFHRFEALPAVRSIGTFIQIAAVSLLPGVTLVEAVPVLYPVLHEAIPALGVRDPSDRVFPTFARVNGADGSGVVIAFLDTGINDAPDGSYPGHESLAGRCLGGASFIHPDSLLNTPRDGSVNPSDHGGSLTGSHGTHVAGIALGNGGDAGYAVGVAPGARFVDVKVLDDAGHGGSLAEALDWCIHNRNRNWGGPAGYEGIDVINLSLSSFDDTDGNDMASLLADRAVELGMVVVASMGNDGRPSWVPSPAGGDRVLAVGALDIQHTPLCGDDQAASFSNSGPRASDQDGDPANEQKPDLLAPGVAILAPDGDLSSDGRQYQRLSGTSMSAAFVSGAAALLRSANPSLDPGQIRDLLRATAFRDFAAPAGQGGSDPRWRSTRGFGAIDLYAAWLESEQPARSQIARLELSGSENEIDAVLRTQRELGAAHFVIERASDQDGVPGDFAPYDSVAAAGDGSLADPANRTSYARTWTVPANEHGASYWYRVSYTEGGVRYDTPSRRFVSPLGPHVATIELTVVHNAYDHDIAGQIEVEGVTSASRVSTTGNAALVFPLPGSSAASSSEWVTGASTFGNVAWNFALEIPAGAAESFLPPDPTKVWRLRLTEGGYLNRSGRVTAYRLTWHSPGGDQVYEGGPLPQPTLEGQTATVRIPQGFADVGAGPSATTFRIVPNPALAGGAVRFFAGAGTGGAIEIFDVSGRMVGHTPLTGAGATREAVWSARDGAGQPLPSGVYFARAGRFGRRIVLLGP